MAASGAATVKEYIDSLSPERRADIQKVRRIIRKNLPPGFKEGMQYGCIGYYVPFSRLADTYNGEPLSVAGLASQKNHMAVYLMSVYGSPNLRRWFEQEYRKSGKKLDMGKSCLRFRSVERPAPRSHRQDDRGGERGRLRGRLREEPPHHAHAGRQQGAQERSRQGAQEPLNG